MRYSWILFGLLILGPGAAIFAAENSTSEEITRWNFDNDTDGWQAQRECKLSNADGALIIDSQGNDPHLSVSVDAPAGWKELSFRAKFKGRYSGQIFWTTAKQPGTSENRSVNFHLRSRDENWHEYKVYFKPAGKVSGLRLDPNNRKGRTRVDWIALANRQPPPPMATPVDRIKLAPGFKAELLYSVPSGERGSWVSLTVDDKGRLITSDQYGKLYRITPPAIGSQGEVEIETIDLELGFAHGLLYAFDSLYVMANEKDTGLYRARDTNGDDKFDEVKLLRKLPPGKGEHGAHAIILTPDKKSLYICAGNHTPLPDPEKSRVPRNWDEDLLLGRQWDAGGHAVGKLAPGGWICRTDPDGKELELISSGYRNEYDIAVNADGELFTFDADMEWDIGLPWYRPTRVCHATSGSEFGWRSGTGKWPAYYPDSLPAAVDIGPGSPTGIVFGYGTKFPAKYQNALFISDWSYGIIYAVHLEPKGSTYIGSAERFVSAAPLPGTDLVVNPKDGALYFTIGGRRTQSGLYRVTYVGDEPTKPVSGLTKAGEGQRRLRHELEALHTSNDAKGLDTAWPHLSNADRHIRFAARIAVEHREAAKWQDRALAENDPQALILAMVALARNGDKSLQSKMIGRLCDLDWGKLTRSQKLQWLRAVSLAFARMGQPNEASRKAVLRVIDARFPATGPRLNRELCQVLVYLEAPKVAERTVKLLETAPTQEEQIHYAFCLRNLKSGWTMPTRSRYFEWFLMAAGHRGGHSFTGFLANIRKEAVDTLNEKEKKALEPILSKSPMSSEPADTTPRSFVKKWTVAELMPELEAGLSGHDFENGRKMFAATQCFKCHRFDGQGGTVGPDLTAVARRYNSQTLLDSLIEPSKVVSDQYEATMFQMEDGRTVVGRVANLSNDTIMVIQNMLDPGNLTALNRNEIEAFKPSTTSQMPAGLLDTLNKKELLDLVAYLRSGGNPDDDAFKP